MGTKKNLLSFLFLESAEAEAAEQGKLDMAENLEKLFEAAASAEAGELEAKKTPLAKALGTFGISDADLQLDPEGFSMVTDNHDRYVDALTVLGTPEAMHKLAEMGWVVTRPGDAAMTNEPPEYRIRFLEITTVDTGDKDKSSQDQEEIVKKAREFAATEMDREDELSPIENEDGKMGKRETGVGDAKDGADPEGKPKGSTGRVPESRLSEMTSTASMGTLDAGPQFIAGAGLVKKPRPYGRATRFKTPGQWTVKQPIVKAQEKRHPQSEALGAPCGPCAQGPQTLSAEEFLKEPLPGERPKTICGGCKNEFDYSAVPESQMGCARCPACGAIIDQEGNVAAD